MLVQCGDNVGQSLPENLFELPVVNIARRHEQQPYGSPRDKQRVHEIVILRDYHTLLAICDRNNICVGCSIAGLKIKRMYRVVADFHQPAHHATRQLRVNEKPHAANLSSRLT